jgi:hypothetical protein
VGPIAQSTSGLLSRPASPTDVFAHDEILQAPTRMVDLHGRTNVATVERA